MSLGLIYIYIYIFEGKLDTILLIHEYRNILNQLTLTTDLDFKSTLHFLFSILFLTVNIKKL